MSLRLLLTPLLVRKMSLRVPLVGSRASSSTTVAGIGKGRALGGPFTLDDKDLGESFVRGRGPGGQAINKNRSCVQLVHIPTGVRVHCQEARDLTTNRKIARKLLRDKVDLLENGDASRLGKRIAKIRRRKSRTKRRQGQGREDMEELKAPSNAHDRFFSR